MPIVSFQPSEVFRAQVSRPLVVARVVALFLVLFLPGQPCWADVGSVLILPLSIAAFCIASVAIAVFETLLIVRLFHKPFFKTLLVIVLANVFSTVVGAPLMVLFIPLAAETVVGWVNSSSCLTFYGVGPVNASQYEFMFMEALSVAVVLSFAFTVFIEWPFIWWLLRKEKHSLKRSLLGSLAAQALSYSLVIVPVLALQRSNLVYEPNTSFSKNSHAWVYFLGLTDGTLYRMPVNGSAGAEVIVANLHHGDAHTRLMLRKRHQKDVFDLWCKDGEGERLLKPEFTGDLASWSSFDSIEPAWNYQKPADFLVAPENCEASRFDTFDLLRTDDGNLLVIHPRQHKVQPITWDLFRTVRVPTMDSDTTPLYKALRNATLLPHEEVVFQFGSFVAVFNHRTGQIGFLSRGRGPIVVAPR